MIKKIPLSKPDIIESDIEMVNKVLHTQYLSMGPYIENFEKDFRGYIGCKHSRIVM